MRGGGREDAAVLSPPLLVGKERRKEGGRISKIAVSHLFPPPSVNDKT